MQRRINTVYRALNSPLTLLRAERRLFFFALVMGAAVLNLLHTFLGGVLVFALLRSTITPNTLCLLKHCGYHCGSQH
jgi:hypothetical protein